MCCTCPFHPSHLLQQRTLHAGRLADGNVWKTTKYSTHTVQNAQPSDKGRISLSVSSEKCFVHAQNFLAALTDITWRWTSIQRIKRTWNAFQRISTDAKNRHSFLMRLPYPAKCDRRIRGTLCVVRGQGVSWWFRKRGDGIIIEKGPEGVRTSRLQRNDVRRRQLLAVETNSTTQWINLKWGKRS